MPLSRIVQEAGDQPKQSKKTFIVKIPSKTESSVFGASDRSDLESDQIGDNQDFTQTIMIHTDRDDTTGHNDQTLTDFTLNNIPIEMVTDGGKNDYESGSHLFGEYNRLSLADQLHNSNQTLDQANGIRDHVISIEENGKITIEKIGIDDEDDVDTEDDNLGMNHDPKQPHTPPKFPEWWLRLSSTMLSFLSTGYLVDVWLVCCDGEAVPAHQLILGHASPRLRAWLAEAGRDTQEEAVTVSLPDWDSDTVGQFVSALYQGQLPALRHNQEKIHQLAKLLGIPLVKTQKATSIVKKKIPMKGPTDKKIVFVPVKKEPSSVSDENKVILQNNIDRKDLVTTNQTLSDNSMQFVQTDNGEILLLTGDLNIPGAETGNVVAANMDDEVERVKAIKIAEIKEQQNKVCPHCYNTAINHRFSSPGSDQKFSYKCCINDCATDNLKTARAFNQHIIKHNEQMNFEPASRVCPLCYRPRIEHKNRAIKDEDKGHHRGNLYKCCHCVASKLSAKKFFVHMENHVSKKHVCDICNKGYSYKHLLNEHIWKEHGEGQSVRFNCTWEGCDYSAKYKQTLHTHVMERHHGLKRKHRQEEAYKKMNCPTCNKSLKKWYYHQFHKRTCSNGGNVIYQCELCGKEGFINAVTLENHKRTKHSVDRPYSCEYCPAKYATAMSLSGHRQVELLRLLIVITNLIL